MAGTATRTRKSSSTTTTTTTTRKVAKVPTITHGTAGTVLINLPFIVPGHGQSRMHMHIKSNPNALGWTYVKDGIGGYVMDGSAGKPNADMARVRACVDYWTARGVIIDVKLTATGKARTGRKAAATPEVTEPVSVPATPTRAGSRKVETPVTVAPTAESVSVAEVISSALTKAGMSAEVIAAAIVAVSGAVKDESRKGRTVQGVSAPVVAPVPATPTRARGRKATVADNGVKITMGDDGTRRYALPVGARTRAVAKAVRQAIYADVRNGGVCAGAESWMVTADRGARVLAVSRLSGNSVSPDASHDAVILAAITGAIA